MRGSPVKLGIIVVLALVGIITLATAFDSGVPTTTGAGATPSPSVPKVHRSPKVKPSPNLAEGVHVGVYNGTKVTGEAAIVGAKLSKLGYVVDELLNTVDPLKTTTVYYVKPADQAAATALADSQFTGATVEQEPAGLQVLDSGGNQVSPIKSAHLLVFVGDDYLSK